MRSEPRDNGWGGRCRRGPKEEDGHCTFECRIERRGYREVTGHHLDAGGQSRVFWPARECAHPRAGAQEFVDHESPHAAGGTNHENHVSRVTYW